MAKLIDLDALAGDEKQVKLGGVRYVLPPDLPVELYLKINRFAGEDPSEFEMVETLYSELLNLFRYRQPDLKSLPLSMPQLLAAVARIYGDGAEEEQSRPPRKSSSGGATSSAPRRTRSRS